MKGARFFILVLALLALASVPTAAAPQAGPCAPGAAYDPACDVNHDNQITIADIQLTAGHWNQSGPWVSDNQHNHLGQTWTGTNNPLKLTGSYGAPDYAPLVLSNNAGDGVHVGSAGNDGVSVGSAGNDGVFVVSAGATGVRVGSAGNDGVHVDSAGYDGVHVDSAGVHGVYVYSAGLDGVTVYSADHNGVNVVSAGHDGVRVDSAGYDGVTVGSAFRNGVFVETAGHDGVRVGSAGYDGVTVGSAFRNGVFVETAGYYGVSVASAGDDGMYVGSAEGDGVGVYWAGGDGVGVYTVDGDGVSVRKAGNPSSFNASNSENGFEIAGAEGFGLYVGRADLDGVRIRSAADDAIQIGEDGVFPYFGLYVPDPGTPGDTLMPNTADAAGEWALYTVDKIAAGNMLMSAQTLVAVAGGDQPLALGDVVTAIGLADPIPGALNRLAVMTLASPERASVVGVVSSRMALTPLPGKKGEQDLRSVAGPAQPGDYVAITVLGVAQVKAQDGAAIQPGQRLTVSATPGQARTLQSKLIEGMMVTEGAPVIGAALEAPKDGLVWVLVNPQ